MLDAWPKLFLSQSDGAKFKWMGGLFEASFHLYKAASKAAPPAFHFVVILFQILFAEVYLMLPN